MLFAPVDGLLTIAHPSSPCHLTASSPPPSLRQPLLPHYSEAYSVPSYMSKYRSYRPLLVFLTCLLELYIVRLPFGSHSGSKKIRYVLHSAAVLVVSRICEHTSPPATQPPKRKKLITVLIHTSHENISSCVVLGTLLPKSAYQTFKESELDAPVPGNVPPKHETSLPHGSLPMPVFPLSEPPNQVPDQRSCTSGVSTYASPHVRF